MQTQQNLAPLSLAWLVLNGPTPETVQKHYMTKEAEEATSEREMKLLDALRGSNASVRQLAEMTGVDRKMVGVYMRGLVLAGRVVSWRIGSNRYYSLSDRELNGRKRGERDE